MNGCWPLENLLGPFRHGYYGLTLPIFQRNPTGMGALGVASSMLRVAGIIFRHNLRLHRLNLYLHWFGLDPL